MNQQQQGMMGPRGGGMGPRGGPNNNMGMMGPQQQQRGPGGMMMGANQMGPNPMSTVLRNQQGGMGMMGANQMGPNPMSTVLRNQQQQQQQMMPMGANQVGASQATVLRQAGGRVGVGCAIKSNGNGQYFISQILPGSPADMSGQLNVGDVVTEINGMPLMRVGLEDIRELLLGMPGTMLNLCVTDSRTAQQRRVNITRMAGTAAIQPTVIAPRGGQQQQPPMMMNNPQQQQQPIVPTMMRSTMQGPIPQMGNNNNQMMGGIPQQMKMGGMMPFNSQGGNNEMNQMRMSQPVGKFDAMPGMNHGSMLQRPQSVYDI